MKKIACVGYHSTGAGVIDCLFREFDNVMQGTYEVEARMIQDPDCVSDLEYNLVENPHRLNSGFAIKRFKQYVDKTNRSYRKIFGNEWKRISYEYADSLADFQYDGYWHGDIWILNPILRYYHTFRRALAKLTPKRYRKPAWYNYFPWIKSYHVCISEEEFLKKTRLYIDELCEVANKKNAEYVVLDQLIAPDQVERQSRYVNDLKIIIVDRDPRDVYIDQMINGNHVLPKDPLQFSKAYRDCRKHTVYDSEICMSISFEDLIYRYDESIKKVMDFVGIDIRHHIHPQTVFKPEISIKNTKQWERYPEYSGACEVIAKNLPELLHRFE